MPMALKPGVIPLRPLSLSDIFNGAVGYIRANPKATLGFTTVVVVITEVLALHHAGRTAGVHRTYRRLAR